MATSMWRSGARWALRSTPLGGTVLVCSSCPGDVDARLRAMSPAVRAAWKKVLDKARADATAKSGGSKRFQNLQGFAKATLKRRMDEKVTSPGGDGPAGAGGPAGGGSAAALDTSIGLTRRAMQKRDGMASYVVLCWRCCCCRSFCFVVNALLAWDPAE